MSRGLGTAQRLILKALVSLEAEHRQDDGSRFCVWAIVDRAYALSSEMQARHQAVTEATATRRAAIQERAASGEDLAIRYLGLTMALTRTRRGPRARRTTPFWLTETEFNPSRVLASLERRGLVSRQAVKGGGAARLTDEGRQVAGQLSVGTTCDETPERAHG